MAPESRPRGRNVQTVSWTRFSVVQSDPEIMSGTPVFMGTQVPFQTLLDYIEAGQAAI